jgi:hypothetical protein
MNKETVSKLLEFIRNEPKLEQIQDGFLYHGLYFTNEQIIEIWKHQNIMITAKERFTK